MQRCLEQINGGNITRYPGGFWYPDGNGKTSYGTTTVEALVKRGALEYCEWKESHARKFPIKAKTVAALPNALDQPQTPRQKP